MAFLGYLPKLKLGLGIAPGTHSLHDFSIKMFFIFNTLSIDKVSMFLFRQLMTSQILRFIFHQPLKQWLTGRKRGEDGNAKI